MEKEGCKDTLIVLLHIDVVCVCVSVYTRTQHAHDACKLPATRHKKGVAKREQLINPAVLGPDGYNIELPVLFVGRDEKQKKPGCRP